MNIIFSTSIKPVFIRLFLFLILSFSFNSLFSQITIVQGIVKDSVSGTPISYATVRFADSTIGDLSEENGKFKISNRQNKNTVIVSLMGYNTKEIKVPVGVTTTLEVLLSPEGVSLNEVVIRPGKEKYSKKNNPAVELIKKVIENKSNYLITNRDYYKSEEYDRIIFALDEFDSGQPQFKKLQFLNKYAAKSKIDDKIILPLSLRETLTDVYYRKDPEGVRRVVKAHQNEGLDQGMDSEMLDAVIAETFKNVSLADNNINLLLRDFVGPLNNHLAVDFYKWYIIDTVNIDNERFVNLGFVPFNPRDVGFSGNLYITIDSTYAVKRASLRVPTKINVNFVDEMVIQQDFERLSPELWIPKEFTTAISLNMYKIAKFYIEKIKTFDDFIFDMPVDPIFFNPAPEIYLSGYNKRDKEFWETSRPPVFNDDYQLTLMMEDLMSNKFLNVLVKSANILSSGYIATNKDEEKNKIDIGTTLTFYSFNTLEGNRFRLTGSTTKNFHPHLFLYGYAAYGTKDGKFKYSGEATWSFNRRNYHKDEFPRNNLSIGYKYDVNALGQRFLQAERDNIFMSGSSSKSQKLTYDKMSQLSYIKEYYNGLSFNIFGTTLEKRPAKHFVFEKMNEFNKLDTISNMKTTEVGLIFRYAHNEKFFQRRRDRRSLPSQGFIYTLSLSAGIKDFLGGQYNYQKASLSVSKQFWIPPAGRILAHVQGEKVFGEVPFPLLLSANANSSYTIQRGSFYLLEPLEFINDIQLSWDITYRMQGWLFNRIPVIKLLGWREVFGFRGFIGDLSNKNNPMYNSKLMLFPEGSFAMGKDPYMEISIGIENILQFFRIDYVRRLNYRDHPNINKDGFRISFDVNF